MIISILAPSSAEPVGGVISLYHLANALTRRGHEVHLAHAPMWGRRLADLADLDWFTFEPEVIHHHPDLPSRPPVGSEIVFGTGGSGPLGLPVLLIQGVDMLHPALERTGFRTPCLKVCVASWLVDVGIRYGAPPEQLVVVLCGLDPQRFVVRTPPEDRAPHVAVLHHTHVAKGWPVAIEALEEVHAHVPGLTSTVFGTTAPSVPLPPWAEFRLAPDHDDLAVVYDRAQVFVQASHFEGLGLTAIEAMSCGAALATTDCGGSRDYAIHEETALVSPPGDPHALARNVERLLGDDDLRVRLAHAGRRHVQRFDWDRGAAELEVHLERYLADPAAYQQPPGPEQPFAAIDHLAGVEGVPTAPSARSTD